MQDEDVSAISEKLQPVANELSADALDVNGRSVNSIHSLDNFWKRFNKVCCPNQAYRFAFITQTSTLYTGLVGQAGRGTRTQESERGKRTAPRAPQAVPRRYVRVFNI